MPDHKIALITDSGCDLADETLQKHDIDMVPLYIIWGQENLRDRVDLTPKDFYARLVSDPVHPSTSQPAPGDFVQAIERAQQRGADAAVIVTISSGMSSTYESATQASQMTDFPVTVIDSKANSLSQGFAVMAAAQARDAGGTVDDIRAAVLRVQQSLVTMLYVDTLEYLHKGGRIGAAARWVGTVLNLKPQLYVDHTTGKIEPGQRARSRSKALDMMYRAFFEKLDTRQPLHIGLVHALEPTEAAAIAARIEREYKPVELLIATTSPMMGVHTGPGALAFCGYAEM